ncbi:GNAT family N-acetyltransferase [Sphingomonas sp. MS122]|uniref:GNAT family N-acetyltransferase n=1 Tax=Sphingomonas sp. MS122 TaxID=3412683 RepID=UPI003C2EE7A2
MIDPSARFDEAFAARAPALACRAEQAADAAFLIDLAIACSPLAGTLPEPMLVQQAEFQHAAHNAAHPRAMRRIALCDGRPLGRIMVTWDAHESYGVDIAVLPEVRGTGVGLGLLRAWLDVADLLDQPARLEVRFDNPAARIYARLGFRPAPDPAGWSPMVTMLRPARSSA